MGYQKTVSVALSLDTSAYADGDLLADTQEIPRAARKKGESVTLRTLNIIDKDDQKQPMTLVFLESAQTLGTENAAPAQTDANTLKVLGHVKVVAGDYQDLGGASVACLRNVGLQMAAAAGATSLYVAVISGGTGTYTAAGVEIDFAFDQN